MDASPLETLLAAKAESDRRNYARKHQLMRDLIARHPGQFVIDSDDGKGILGLTHVPTKFKMHLPAGVPPVSLESEIKKAEHLLASVAEQYSYRAAEELLKLAAGAPFPLPGRAPISIANSIAEKAIARAAPAAKVLPKTSAPKPILLPKPEAPIPKVLPSPKSVPLPKDTPLPKPVLPVEPTGSVAGKVVRAPINYTKSLAGYGESGSLQGQKLFDSTSVKPRMYRSEYKKRLAAGEKAEDLAKTHQLPSWTERIPGAGTIARVGHALNKNRFTHPFVQAGNTISNVAITPLTRPLTKPIEKLLFELGSKNVARGGLRGLLGRAQQAGGGSLWAGDAAIGTVGRLGSYGSLGIGAYESGRRLWNKPGQEAETVLRAIPGTNQSSLARNTELQSLKKNPIPALWDGLTDGSDLSRIQQRISRRLLPNSFQSGAAKSLQEIEGDPFTRAVYMLRLPTLSGLATRPALRQVAQIPRVDQETVIKEELNQGLPKVLENYGSNVNSPTGQRMLRLTEPAVKDMGLPYYVNDAIRQNTPPYTASKEIAQRSYQDRVEASIVAQKAIERQNLPRIASDPLLVNVIETIARENQDATREKVPMIVDNIVPSKKTDNETDKR